MGQNAVTEQYEEITVLGKPALFTSNRIDRSTIPDGLYAYDVRHDDDCQGIPCEIAKHIMVNHWGTILLAEPLQLPERGFLLIDADTDWNYAPIDHKPLTVASIEYLGFNGKVRETQQFCDEAEFRKTMEEELYCGVPLCMVAYEFGADENKWHIPMDWVEDLDTLPCGMRYGPCKDDSRTSCCTVQEFLQQYGQNKTQDKTQKEPQLPDRYEIYQIKNNAGCKYLYCGYATAQPEIQASDYRCAYAAALPTEASLEDLYALHNRDDRTAGRAMRSLSVSDIVVLYKGKQATAHYVDSIGFAEIPNFADKLEKQRASKSDKAHEER